MRTARFASLYDTEEKCILLIKKWRLNEGVRCRRCQSMTHYWIATRLRFRCTNCRRETTLRSGTALEYSKLSYLDWVHALLVLTDSKKPVSAAHLQRILRLKYYVPAWSMLHKIRYAMGQAMKSKKGMDWKPVDCVGLPVLAATKDEAGEDLRAMIRSWRVFIEVESGLQEESNNDIPPIESKVYTPIHLRAQLRDVMPPVFRIGLASDWIPKTKAAEGTHENNRELVDSDIDALTKRDQEGSLSWLGIIWLNARRNFHGIYHNISEKYVQNYLSEFSFLTNHRHLGSQKFDVLLSLILSQTWFVSLVQASVYSGNASTETGP
jgi:transposase-like protein